MFAYFFFFSIEKNKIFTFFRRTQKLYANTDLNAPQKITLNTIFKFDFGQKFAEPLSILLSAIELASPNGKRTKSGGRPPNDPAPQTAHNRALFTK